MHNDKKGNYILAINSGSSSLKFSIYEIGENEKLIIRGSIDRIGSRESTFQVAESLNPNLIELDMELPNHEAAFRVLFNWLENNKYNKKIDAVGHRLVNGGSSFIAHHFITSQLISNLKKISYLAPDHLSQQIKGIETVGNLYTNLNQVACFDTVFHNNMPKQAKMFALPREFWDEGVMRYGFHGLSYEYIIQELNKEGGSSEVDGRIIIAHLGNGASMVAVKNGKGVDTTMGFTPTGGLMMSTRSGDLDPGIISFLLEEKKTTPLKLYEIINKKSGLYGVSGISSDMKELLEKEAENPHAADAINIFCYQAKKYLGAMASVLEGVGTIIFTGGIGENSPEIRKRICSEMEFLGIQLNLSKNETNSSIISIAGTPTTVRVIKTNEELMIARHTYCIINKNNHKDAKKMMH
ncbi:MAG: acetate kinase [Thermodesulfobacteriota bacterium]|nr:MAG: acetate kinase [Thermodesulfobacteriota bacterium]